MRYEIILRSREISARTELFEILTSRLSFLAATLMRRARDADESDESEPRGEEGKRAKSMMPAMERLSS